MAPCVTPSCTASPPAVARDQGPPAVAAGPSRADRPQIALPRASLCRLARSPVFDADALWSLARVGEPSLARRRSRPWSASASPRWRKPQPQQPYLLSTLGGRPRRLTGAGDRTTPALEPRGDQIAFIAKRHSDSWADAEPQLYLIAPTAAGPPRRRAAHRHPGPSKVVPGRPAHRLCRLGLAELKHAAQGPRMQVERERKDSATSPTTRSTAGGTTTSPGPRTAPACARHRHGPRARPLRRHDARTRPHGPQRRCLRHRPDGPAPGLRFRPRSRTRLRGTALRWPRSVRSRQHRVLLQDNDCTSTPSYSHSGRYLAFPREPSDLRPRHNQLGVATFTATGPSAAPPGTATSPRRCIGHLKTTPSSLPPKKGRRHHLADQLPAARWTACAVAATSAPLTQAQTCVVQHDSLHHPPRLSVLTDEGPRRIEHFNDALLARHHFGEARSDGWKAPWVCRPGSSSRPFRPAPQVPVLHLIHGGPTPALVTAGTGAGNLQAFAAQGCVVACVPATTVRPASAMPSSTASPTAGPSWVAGHRGHHDVAAAAALG